jgi:hypothetical protein
MPPPAERVLVLRPPLWTRLYAVVFSAAIVIWLTVQAVRFDRLLPPILIGAAACLIAWRSVGIAVIGGRDELWVRNAMTRARTLGRAEVTGFRTSDRNRPATMMVVAVRDADIVPLEVTSELVFVPGWRQRLERKLARLEAWRAGDGGAAGGPRVGT